MAAGRLLVDSGPPLSHKGCLAYRNGCPGDRARSAPSVGPGHFGLTNPQDPWYSGHEYLLWITLWGLLPRRRHSMHWRALLFSCQSNNGSPNDINPPQFPCKKAWCVPAGGAERLRAPRPHTRLSTPPTIYSRLTSLPIRFCMSISDIPTPPQSF